MPEERFLGNTDVGINKEVSFPGFGNQLDATQKGEGFINEGFCKCPVGPLLPGKCFCENWIWAQARCQVPVGPSAMC